MVQNQFLLKQTLQACRRSFFYAFLFSFFINILMLAMPIYSLQVLDRVLSSFSIETLIFITIIIGVMIIFWGILQISRNFIFAQIGIYLERQLEPYLVDKIIDDSVTNHEIGSRYVRDLNVIKSFINNPAIGSLFDTPFAIIYFAVIFFIHPINGFITVFGAIILIFMAILNEKLASKNLKQANDLQQQFFNQTEALTSSSEALIAMGMKQNVIKQLFAKREQIQSSQYKAQSASYYVNNITKIIRFFIQIITMAVGAVLVIKNKMSPGGIIATSILAGKALAPFDAITAIWQQFFNSKKSYDKLSKILANIEAEKDKTNLPKPKGFLKLTNVNYKLANENNFILKSINLQIDPGEVVAVIGPSGSGKTTLARMIAGIIEASTGKVTIDNAKLQNYNRNILGQFIGYLPQQIEFIHATIKQNIARMDEKIDDGMVIEAAKAASSHEMILNFPKGYDTMVENLGKNLSQGQKQRIALCRCFYKNVKLLILDEPNSNLDADGEKALTKSLKFAKANKMACLIISHRTAILDQVDKVIVMNKGKIEIFDEKNIVLSKLAKIKQNAS